MKGYVVDSNICCKRKTYVRPVKHDYRDEEMPYYYKYSCPVCDQLDNTHQVHPWQTNCPLCGVNLYWDEDREEYNKMWDEPAT